MSLARFEDSWEQLDLLFEQAMRLPPAEREAFCRSGCGADDNLRELLLKLITAELPDDERLQGSVSRLVDELVASQSLAGERVGPYVIDKMLARGGMGEVYLASRADGEFEKQVAVKVISLKLLREEFIRHFKNERQVLARLDHPFIPVLIDAGQLDDGRPYLITEYVVGIPIDEYCDERALSINDRIALIEKLGQAIQHAHGNLVLHLDIKPANILIVADGTPRLLDFGVARLMTNPETGHRAYTAEYASPEQLRGDLPSAASDVYSLGVLSYRLLTGTAPFVTPRYSPVKTKIAERTELSRKIAQSVSVPGLDADLRAILRKAMAESTTQRYTTVEPLLSDLRKHRRHLPVSARPATLPYRLSKYARRHVISLGVAAAIAAMSIAFGAREFQLRREAQAAYAQSAEDANALRQVKTFLIDLFEVSDPGESRGNTVTARELLDRGAERIAEDLAGQPQLAAQMMNVMGSVHVKLGLYDHAATLLEESLRFGESVKSADDLELAGTLNSLGDVYRRQARFDEAEPVILRGLEIRERLLGPIHADVAASLRMLGHLYMRQGRFDEAERAHLRGISIIETTVGSTDPDFAEHINALAMVYFDQGRNEESEKLYLRAIEILEHEWGADHPDLASYFERLSNLYNNNMQRYDEAAVYMRRSLALREAAFEPDHPLVAMSYLNYSSLLFNMGELDEAEAYLLRALSIQEKNFASDDWRIASIQHNLADLYAKRGRLEDAEQFARVAFASFSKNLRANHPFLGHSNMLLAGIYRRQGLYDEAGPFYQRALTIFGELPLADPNRQLLVKDYAVYLQATGRSDEAARDFASE